MTELDSRIMQMQGMLPASQRAPSWCAYELIRTYEGLYLRAYDDGTGHWTIGYGHTRGVHPDQRCTPQQAEEYLQSDLEEATHYIRNYVDVPLTQGMFDALCSFVFNVGGEAFHRSHMLEYLNAKQYYLASEEFPRWVHAGGKVLLGLQRRRAAEQFLFRYGRLPGYLGATRQPRPTNKSGRS